MIRQYYPFYFIKDKKIQKKYKKNTKKEGMKSRLGHKIDEGCISIFTASTEKIYINSISEKFSPLVNMFNCKLAYTISNILKSLIKKDKDRLSITLLYYCVAVPSELHRFWLR